jgi:ketosteroid isomerase-like protein
MRTNLQIVQEHYAASERMDMAGMLADLAPDGVWVEMDGAPYSGTYVGAREVTSGVFARIGSEWKEFFFQLERLFDAGDTIFATGWYRGAFGKTGKSFRGRTVHVWHLADGKIRRFEQFTDTLRITEAMR